MVHPTINHIDDVLPLLDAPHADTVTEYRHALTTGIARTSEALRSLIADNANLTQKEFATGPAAALPPVMRGLAFTCRNGAEPESAVRRFLADKATTQTSVDETRELHGATWAL